MYMYEVTFMVREILVRIYIFIDFSHQRICSFAFLFAHQIACGYDLLFIFSSRMCEGNMWFSGRGKLNFIRGC